MLAVSPAFRITTKDESQGEMETSFSIATEDHDFQSEFSSDGNILDSIDFDDLFMGINDGDVLPDLEMDPEMFAEFSISGESEVNASSVSVEKAAEDNNPRKEENSGSDSGSSKGEEYVSKKLEEATSASTKTLVNNNKRNSNKEGDKGRKSSTQAKNNQGKRKVKVDWTPELHRRFVQAVEQLGVDKAVPSRILELMGIDCLTRHNIASHLQKYRSHRKHLLAREAEAASWSQRRQMYGAPAVGGGGGKRDMSHWVVPTMGFPPITTPMHHHFRSLHVWGHPTVDQSLVHAWPKHLAHSPSPPPPPPAWAPPPPDPSYWQQYHHHNQKIPNGLRPGTPCFPQPLAKPRFATPPVPGIPPPHHSMYKVEAGIAVLTGQLGPHPPIDFYPSKESIDAAIGDVLSKPWLPLPLGLKPPSLDGVLGELQRQGIPKIPPTCA